MTARLHNYIDGAFVAPQENVFLENVSPVDGGVISLIPDSTAADVDRAVAAAKEALQRPSWHCDYVTMQQRAAWLRKIADGIESKLELFARAESIDTGKPLSLARSLDIPRAIENFRYYADFSRSICGDTHPAEKGGFHYTTRRPVGVVALITPWNLPLYLLSWKIAPALMLGNAIVAKPSEMTPTTATLLAEVCHEIGLPRGVLNIVHGVGPRCGQAILEHRGIHAISFTGGTATGAIVAATAGRTFKKLSLELGGKNPNVIFADCDLDRAVETSVRSSFTNAGQVCLCGSRILVERAIYDEFLARFVERVKKTIVVGVPDAATTTMGPVISFAHREKIERMIATAREQGGQVLLGGERPNDEWAAKGAFLQPTIIAGLAQHCESIQQEIFGPVVTINAFDSESEAIALANGVAYGLSATLWTSHLERAHRVAQSLECGMVWVNDWLVRDLSTPFGGVKASGVGREGGQYSLEFYSETKNIYIHLPRPPLPAAEPVNAPVSAPVPVSVPVPPPAPAVPAPVASTSTTTHTAASKEQTQQQGVIDVSAAPKPVGAYPHARKHGDLLFLSGIGPRTPGTNAIPGGPIRDANKQPLNYDVAAQTHQVIENIRLVLQGCGATLQDIIDVQVFLIDMDRDFAAFNKVYGEYFKDIQATRTTIAINALPTPIAVEFKVIAKVPGTK